MNIKIVSIVLTVLLVVFLVTVLMQKGSYVGQAAEHYKKTTDASFKGGQTILEYVNKSVEENNLVWALACDAVQNAKSSQDQARLEAKYFTAKKGSNNKATMSRRFEATSAYFIDTKFSKVEVDKKTSAWFLNNLVSIDVGALLGNPTVAEEAIDEEEGEVEEEEEVEEAPAPAKPAKAAKGKKGKKGKKR